MNPGAGEGYISTMKLSVGTVDVKDLDAVTENIVSYDRCEKNDAYIGQINMLTVSSFCGLNGAVWGFDLAKHDDIASGAEKPMYMQSQPDGPDIPVYNVRPLLEATERLFGKEQQRRFPPMPGSHIICANKDVTARGPLWVWSAIGIAILKDRSKGSSLFIEDANTYGNDSTTELSLIHIQMCIRDRYIAFLDDDDYFLKDRINEAIHFLQNSSADCGGTCCNYVKKYKNKIYKVSRNVGCFN